MLVARCFPPRHVGFRGPEIPKQLPYSRQHFQLQPLINFCDEHWLHFTNPDASSSDALTGLSYTAIQSTFVYWYRSVRISPPELTAVSHRACSPPAGDKFDGLPPPLPGIRTPSHVDRVPPVSACIRIPLWPISVSPNLPIEGDWVERDITVPSAHRSRTSGITRIRLQRMLSQDG